MNLTESARSYTARGFRKLLYCNGLCLVQEDGLFPWGQDDKTEGPSTRLPSSTKKCPAEPLGSSVVSPAIMCPHTTDDINLIWSPM